MSTTIVNHYAFARGSTRHTLFNPTWTDVDSFDGRVVAIGVETKSGGPNPLWRQQVAAGINASTSYHRIGWRLRPGTASCESKYDAGHYQIYSKHTTNWVCPFPSFTAYGKDPDLEQQATRGLKRKLSAHSGEFNALVPVAELGDLRKTLRGITSSASGMMSAMIDIKRTRGKSAAKFAADKWLTWSFGIRPLISDANAAAKAISTYVNRQNHTVRLTAGASRAFSTRYVAGYAGTVGSYVDCELIGQHKLSYLLIAAFDMNVSAANGYGVDDHFGLNFGSMVQAAWELTPYSWVVDYFTTAGDFLDDTFTTPGGVPKYSVLCRRHEISGTVRTYHTPKPQYVLSGSDGRGTFDYFEFERTSYGNSLPRTTLRFRSVDEVGLHGVNKLLNLASVLIGRTK